MKKEILLISALLLLALSQIAHAQDATQTLATKNDLFLQLDAVEKDIKVYFDESAESRDQYYTDKANEVQAEVNNKLRTFLVAQGLTILGAFFSSFFFVKLIEYAIFKKEKKFDERFADAPKNNADLADYHKRKYWELMQDVQQ